jgi:selenocysteine lyase/cysteine desulfurase
MSVTESHAEQVADVFRSSTPALSRLIGGASPVYMDAPGGSQMPQCVLDAMAGYIRDGMANRHGAFQTSIETEAILARARQHDAGAPHKHYSGHRRLRGTTR